MDRRVTQLLSSMAVAAVGIMSAGLVAQPAAATPVPTSDCVTACTKTFDTIGDGSFTIPTGISTLTATLAGSAGAPLASTGAAVAGGVVVAVLLLGGGAAFFFISRRRRGPVDKP